MLQPYNLNTVEMSAIREENGESPEPIQVLFALYPNMSALDFTGPLEVLNRAQHNKDDPGKGASMLYFRVANRSRPDTKAFDCTFVAAEEHTMTLSGASFRAHINYKEAHKRLAEFDVLVVPGGEAMEIIKSKAEPLDLIEAFTQLQEKDPSHERTIFSIDTGSLLLAKSQILQGLAATTHPDYYIKLELLCQEAATKDVGERTDVMEGERYVVNQGRFDVGDLEDNPYVAKKGRRASSARKGSTARKMSVSSRDAIKRRASMRLGGMRVITAGGSTSGLDASLYLVSAMVSHEVAQEVSRTMQFNWIKGVVVDSIDV